MAPPIRRGGRRGGGGGIAGVMFYAPDGIKISLSFKLEFPYSSAEVKYEALIILLISILLMRICRLGCKKILSSLLDNSTENLP